MKARILRKTILSFRPDRLVRNLSYFVVIGIFTLGGYLFFYRIFCYLGGVELIGDLLIQKILQTAFLVFFTMLFMSNVISSLSTFFKSEELDFLFSKPLPPETIFSQKFTENLFYSSWATLIAGVPIVLAYGVASSSPLWFYPLALLALLLFILVPAGFGVTLLIAVSKFLPRVRRRDLILGLGGLVFLIVVVQILFRGAGGFRIPATFDLAELDSYVRQLGVASPLLPSTWLVGALTATASGELRDLTLYILLLLTTGSLSLTLAFFTASRLYSRAWFSSAESPPKYSVRVRRRVANLSRRLALVDKDMRLFLRDPSQWSQALIFTALLGVYVISLKRTPIYFRNPFWLILISFVNLGFTGYILATLFIRFVFPAMSLEGATYWIIKSSPMPAKDLLWGKLSVNFGIGLALAEGLVVATNLSLGVEPSMLILSVVSTAFFTFSLVSLSVGLGSLFPDFKERNPSKIASGPGGVITAIFSLLYVGFSIAIIAWPVHLWVQTKIAHTPFPLPALFYSGAAFLAINALSILLPLKLGVRALVRREV